MLGGLWSGDSGSDHGDTKALAKERSLVSV